MTGLDRVSTFSDGLCDEMDRHDYADREAKCIADDAEAMNREYRTITTEQANDLARALTAINALLWRVE